MSKNDEWKVEKRQKRMPSSIEEPKKSHANKAEHNSQKTFMILGDSIVKHLNG